MLNKVQRDLLKKHIGPFLFCFFTVMFLLLMQFLMLHVDKLVGKGLPFSIVAELILTNLAYMVVMAVPMAVLVSTLIAFGKFSEWNELTAIRAAGVNPSKLILPVLGAGFLLFLAMAYFSNYILPEANHKARSLFIDIRMAKPGFDLQEGTFYEGIEGFTFLVQTIDADTDSLYDVTVFQEPTDDRYRAYIRAKSGWLQSDDDQTLSLFLHEGSIMRYIPGKERNEETLEQTLFNRYRMSFDLSDLAFSRQNPDNRSRTDRTMSAQAMMAAVDSISASIEKEYDSLLEKTAQHEMLPFKPGTTARSFSLRRSEQDTIQAVQSNIEILNMFDSATDQANLLIITASSLGRYKSDVNTYKSNREWRNFRIAEFMVEIHKKLSIPFACMVFVIIGAPIGMLTRKGNIGVAGFIGAIILTFYFVALIQGEKLADRMVITPFMGMWGINLFLLAIGIILWLHVTTSLKFTNLLNKDA